MKIASICMESEVGTVRSQESGTTTPVVVIIGFLVALLYFARSLHTKVACNASLLLLSMRCGKTDNGRILEVNITKNFQCAVVTLNV